MNDLKEAQLKMAKSTTKHCDDNLVIIQTIPKMVAYNNKTKNTIAQIEAEKLKQGTPTTGLTSNKADFRLILETTTDSIITSGFAYAHEIKDNDLETKMNYGTSKLSKMRELDLITYCTNVYNWINPIIASLADYGLLPADMTKLHDDTENFAAHLDDPNDAIKDKESTNRHIDKLFVRLLDGLKNQQDKIAKRFKATEPGFYASYLMHRKVTQFGVGAKGLLIHTKNSITNESIEEVKFTIPNEEVNTIEYTDVNGDVFFHITKDITITINAHAEGYIDYNGTMVLKSGLINKLTVSLVPAPPIV